MMRCMTSCRRCWSKSAVARNQACTITYRPVGAARGRLRRRIRPRAQVIGNWWGERGKYGALTPLIRNYLCTSGGGRTDGFPGRSRSSAREAFRFGGRAVAVAPLVRCVSYGRPISSGGWFWYRPTRCCIVGFWTCSKFSRCIADNRRQSSIVYRR